MRTIEKGPQPGCLSGLRREAARIEKETRRPPTKDDWAPKDCGDPIREALCREQGGLCAYCMRRIRPNRDSMKIEHFIPRSRDPGRMYDWGNLLGVCKGVLRGGREGEVLTCDTARGDRPLHIHPAKLPPRPETVFEFDKRGNIMPKGEDAANDCKALNLGAKRLRDARRAVIKDFSKRLQNKDDPATIRRLLETARTPNHDGLLEYAAVVIGYLERKLRSHEARRS